MTDVWKLYEAHARAFDRDRGRSLMERGYLTDVVNRLRPKAQVLDLGCGPGEPIARFFIERGFELTGVDAAPEMLVMCRERFPHAIWVEADMRGLVLPVQFDAVVAWDSFFHLARDEQRAMFPTFAKHVARNGLLLFTSGPRDGEVLGISMATRCTMRALPLLSMGHCFSLRVSWFSTTKRKTPNAGATRSG